MAVLHAKIAGAWVPINFTSPPEVHIGSTTPPGPQTIWIDTSTDPPTTKAWVGGAWVTVGTAGGSDEVWIGTADPMPANPEIELWYDTDAPAPAASVAGVPSGGTAGQVLAKKTATSFDTEWRTNPQIFRAFLAANTSVPAAGALDVVTLSVPVTPAGTILMATFSTAYLHPSGITGAFDLAYSLGSQSVVDQRNDGSGTSKCTSMTLVGLSTGAGLTAKIVINNWGGQATNFYGTYTNIVVQAVAP